MQERPLQLAIITEAAYRAEVVEYMAAGRGWRVLALVAQPHPLEALHKQPVDLVLIDLEIPGAVALFGELNRSLPQVPLLALITPQNLGDLEDARLAGAADFVAFPINHRHFHATLTRALRLQPSATVDEKTGRIIALASLKGGVGRSTLAANLAVALSQRQSGSVILLEAHHGISHLSLLLNLHPRHSVASLATETSLDLDLLQGFLQPHQSGVRLLAAPSELSQVVTLEREAWQNTLHLLTQLATYVIVDTAATIDMVLSEVLSRAHELLLVTGPEIASLYSARALLASLQAEKEVQGQRHIILNQAGANGGLSPAIIEKHLGAKIAAAIQSDSPLVTYALNRGIPFVTSHPQAPISRHIHKLVDALLTDSATASEAPPHRRSAFLRFLGQRKAQKAAMNQER